MELNQIFKTLKIEPSENLENETLEFKNFKDINALFNSKEFNDEICAFANSKGGKIIVGVVDSSDIKNSDYSQQLCGFQQVDISAITDRILGRLKPKISLSIYNYKYDGKSYLIIEVEKNKNSIVTTSSGKVYIRQGKSSVPAEPYQIQSLVTNLQSYDWSNEDINESNWFDLLNLQALEESKIDFVNKREIKLDDLDDLSFLESIGATKNGILNFAGLLFLGKVSAIEKYLGLYEYRFSWRTNTGILIKNDVWNDCIWNTIKKVKSYFNEFNEVIKFDYKDKSYNFSLLDDQAFHEAFLNAIVHRDYSTDGMISVNYKGDELIITNPGTFYGGVNEDNISYHEPRHRNKVLAKLLMTYQLVDRAGMGVLRISLNSLKYGREFPVWRQHLDNIEVKMFSEYIKPAIFVLTQEYLKDCNLTDLLLLNKVNEIGHINIKDLEKELNKIYKNPWVEIEKTLSKENYDQYFLLKGNNKGIYITCTDNCCIYLNVSKKFKAASNSEKHIILFRYLKKHKSVNNELVMNLLKFSTSSATYSFLSKLEYVKNTGKSRSSLWSLK